MNWLKDYNKGTWTYEQGEAQSQEARAAEPKWPRERSKTGRFIAGNSGFGGRPKGARSKLTTEFFVDFYAAWQQHVQRRSRRLRRNHRKDFVHEQPRCLCPRVRAQDAFG